MHLNEQNNIYDINKFTKDHIFGLLDGKEISWLYPQIKGPKSNYKTENFPH